jgi:hypothetical protein
MIYERGFDYELCATVVDGKPCEAEFELYAIDSDYDSERGFFNHDVRGGKDEHKRCANCDEWHCSEHMATQNECVTCAKIPALGQTASEA